MSGKLVIFDMDGTLIDSMPYWEHLGRNFLKSKGIEASDDLESIIDPMTLTESATYMKEHYGVEGSVDEIIDGIMNSIAMAYQFEIPPKAGMKLRIRQEKEAGNTVVLLTTSEISCVKGAMRRTGMLRYFDQIYIADELGVAKDKPECFALVCDKHGVAPQEAHVYEDALYAISAAKQAGCFVTAVYDDSMKDSWEEICRITDEQIVCS